MRVRKMPRRGIVLNMNESGTARLVFRRDRAAFVGMLETDNGETISVTGKVIEGSPEPSSSSEPYVMEVLIVDGEAGSSFKLDNVNVFVDGHKISINSAALTFSTNQRWIGAKADVVIQQYLKPSMIEEEHKEVFVGPMKLHLLTTEHPPVSMRRESICQSEQDVILEQSDDFFA
ncbi:unnamed protein product [Heligmosomoides polygyrus]|uniref:FHA domain-containing protein n=1 Tax=Heligmosomoides polygyrus TaxID=6339 RepID=A0A183FII2_HELPZ|nr:unnamed protein product [Heligmosomoides polygyrus]